MKFLSSLSQILGWSVLARVDGVTYSVLGHVLVVNNTANLTNVVVTPTQTTVIAQAGPMQVNLTFLNPIEVRFHSFVKFNTLTYASSKARRLGQAIHPILIYGLYRGIVEWHKSCCAGIFRCQRGYV